MVRRTYAQRSVFEVLSPDGDQLWDAELLEIDTILDDDEIIDVVDAALRHRRPKSGRRGRFGTPVVVVLRMLVLKHLYDWSFAECERDVRGSLVYRAFCRIDCERVPDAKTLIRLAALLGPEALKNIVERLVHVARERRVVRGHRLRVDTTVVETNIHYPTDSSLLADGVRVLTRTLRRIRAAVGGAGLVVRDRTRSLARRVFEITQRSRKATARTMGTVREQTKARSRQSAEYLRAGDRSHSQGQGREADGVRQGGQDSGGRRRPDHRLHRVPDPRAGPRVVAPGADQASGVVRPAAEVGGGGWRVCVGRERTHRHGAAPPRRRLRRRGSAGSVARCAGAPDARAGSVCSNAVTGCGAVGIAGRAGWSDGSASA